jgi:hypothetical protein
VEGILSFFGGLEGLAGKMKEQELTRRATNKEIADIKAVLWKKADIEQRLTAMTTDITNKLTTLLTTKETALAAETTKVAAAAAAAQAAADKA